MVGVDVPLERTFAKFRTAFTVHHEINSIAALQLLFIGLAVILLAVLAYLIVLSGHITAIVNLILHFGFYQLLLHVRLEDALIHRLGVEPLLIDFAVVVPGAIDRDIIGIGMADDIILTATPDIITIQRIVYRIGIFVLRTIQFIDS